MVACMARLCIALGCAMRLPPPTMQQQVAAAATEAAAGGSVLLTAADLSLSYDGERFLFRDISFTLAQGAKLALVSR